MLLFRSESFLSLVADIEAAILQNKSEADIQSLVHKFKALLNAFAATGGNPNESRTAQRIFFKMSMRRIVQSAQVPLVKLLYQKFGDEFVELGLKQKCFDLSWFGIAVALHKGAFVVAMELAMKSDPGIKHCCNAIFSVEKNDAPTVMHVLFRHFSEYAPAELQPLVASLKKMYGKHLPNIMRQYDMSGRVPMHYMLDLLLANADARVLLCYVDVLKQLGCTSFAMRTQNDDTLLHMLACSGKASGAMLSYVMTSLHVNPALRNKDGKTAFDLVVQFCDAATIKMFWVVIPIAQKHECCRLAMHAAAAAGNEEAVLRLKTHIAHDLINAPDDNGDLPAHHAARHGHAHLLQHLQPKNAVNATTGNTPLHLAAQFQYADVLTELLTWDAGLIQPDALNALGYAVIHLAILLNTSGSKTPCIDVVMDSGLCAQSVTTATGDTLLHLFARARFSGRALTGHMHSCDSAMLLVTNNQGQIPLHVAACFDVTGRGTLAYFLSAGVIDAAHFTVQDVNGNTPAHCAQLAGVPKAYASLAEHTPAAIENIAGQTHEQVVVDPALVAELEYLRMFSYRATSAAGPDDPGHLPIGPVHALSAVRLAHSPAVKDAQFYIDQMEASAKLLHEHWVRLFENTFYMFVIYWQVGATTIARENVHMLQHGVAGPGYNAAHDASVIQRVQDDIGRKHAGVFVVPHPTAAPGTALELQKVQVGLADGLHMLDVWNSTISLPSRANALDTKFSDGGNRAGGFPGVRDDYLRLLEEVARGKKDPMQAYQEFVNRAVAILEVAPNYRYYHGDSRTEPAAVRERMVEIFLAAAKECQGDGVMPWLRLSSTDQLICGSGQTKGAERAALLAMRMRQLQREMLASPSAYMQPVRPVAPVVANLSKILGQLDLSVIDSTTMHTTTSGRQSPVSPGG